MERGFPLSEPQHRTERKVRLFGPDVLVCCGDGSRNNVGTGPYCAPCEYREKPNDCALCSQELI